MSDSRTVLILGAGIGGVVAAQRLRRLLPAPHRVVLVEREREHVYAPSLLWVITGQRDRSQISRPIETAARRGIELIQGSVERIDPYSRSVQVDSREIAADYLVIALGAEMAPETVPGLADAGHNLYTLCGAEAIRDARLALGRGRIAVLVSALPFKCPAAPNEAAMLLEADARRRGVRGKLQFDLYTPEPGPMPVAGPEVSGALRQMIEAKGIGYHPEHAVASVDAEHRRIHFANGVETAFDLLVYIPPHRAPRVVRNAGMSGSGGWIAVDRETLETRFPGIYAIGDAAGITLSAIGRPLPKAGVLAHHQGEVAARNIARAVTGLGRQRRFAGDGACFVETGDGRAGYGSGNFYADPAPRIRLYPPSRLLHWGKAAYEKYWLWSRF